LKELSPRQLLVILTGINLFNYFDRYILSAVLPYIQTDFHLNYGDAGRINTAFMLGYFITSPLFGFFGDRSSRKWLIASGILVWSIGTFFSGFALVIGSLLFFRILVGVGEASYASIGPSIISDSYDRNKRNNALTIFYTAIPIGAAIGNIVGGIVAYRYGWRYAFIWAGVPGVFLALMLLPFKDIPRSSGALNNNSVLETKKPGIFEIFRLFTITDYNLTLIGYTAYTFVIGAFAVWGPSYLHRIYHLKEETASTFFGAVLVVTGLLSTLIGGLIATQLQKKTNSGYAIVLTLSVFLTIPSSITAFLTGSVKVSMICFALSMFFMFLSTGPVNTLILETVPGKLKSSAMALSIFTTHLFGDLWSPEIVGRISDMFNSLQKGVLILPAVLVIGTVSWGILGIRLHNKKQSPVI